jgi:Na+/H+-dicarboxylate symporter
MLSLALHWQILIALVAGASAGFLFEDQVPLFAFLGTFFLKALKMIIVPLIATSIITGVSGVGKAGNIGRMGIRTFAYYISTSLFAILIGLILVNFVQPGKGAELGFKESPQKLQESIDKFGDSPLEALQRLVLDMIPTNPFAALANGEILQLIVFSLLFGFFATRISSPYSEHIMRFFQAAFETMMKLTHFIMLFAPIGIFGLVANTVATVGFSAFADLGLYAATVVAGLALHAFVVLPLILFAVGRLSPRRHAQAMAPALLTAFSTSSSSATLPLTMESLETRAGVSNRTTSFVVPLGATINMDGTALYECVAAMFIAQAYGVDLSFGQQVLVVVTALLASVGAAGIPMAGLVMISVILTAVGLPLEGLGLILAVDRVLDMCRTAVNVWSDSCGAAVIARSLGEELKY